MKFPAWLPILLGVLSAVGPVSTDMYLPAFPAIEASLGGHAGAAQITLATWFLGLAVGQMTQGTLADRYGRRGPLIAGTALYTLTCAGCALSPDIVWFSLFRFLCGIGGSASMVIPRAIVRDLSDGHAAARLMSKLMLVMGAAPILAPTLGGTILTVSDWHTIFWLCTLYGAVCCALVVRFMSETLPANRRVKLGFNAQVLRYAGIIRERGFITHALMGGFAMFAMFAYLSGSPPVFIGHFNLSPPLYGMLFGACAAGFIACSQINPRILPRFGASRVMGVAVRVFLTGTIVLTVVAFSGWGGWAAVALPILVVMSCQGFTMPNATVGALSRHAAHAGSASALMGTLQFCLGAASGLISGQVVDGTPRPMAVLMLLGAVGAVLCDRLRPRPLAPSVAPAMLSPIRELAE